MPTQYISLVKDFSCAKSLFLFFIFPSIGLYTSLLHSQLPLRWNLRVTIFVTMPPKKDVSAFEKRRLENIATNQALLKDISHTAVKIAKPPPVSRPVRTKRAPVERKERPKREAAVGTRASSRLKGENPIKREIDNDIPAALREPERPAKKARVSDDLSLDAIMVEGRKFSDNISALGSLLPKMGADPGVRTFDEDDIKRTTNKDLKELRESMNALAMYDKWAVNGQSH